MGEEQCTHLQTFFSVSKTLPYTSQGQFTCFQQWKEVDCHKILTNNKVNDSKEIIRLSIT